MVHVLAVPEQGKVVFNCCMKNNMKLYVIKSKKIQKLNLPINRQTHTKTAIVPIRKQTGFD
jgi:hypothetical protein